MKYFFSIALLTFIVTGCKSQDVNSRTPASVSNQCKGDAPTSSKPKDLLQWMATNSKNKTMEDIICCLPKTFRENYKIVHTSFSAQESHYKSPRLLFGNLANDGIMFSISGGDKNLPQSNSIEVMLDNDEKKELELFDIEIGKDKKHLSGKNPDLCIRCHGSGGELKAGGPRSLMNPAPWPRMVTAQVFPKRRAFCRERNKFFKKMNEKAMKAVENNPRFKCLNKPSRKNKMDFGLDADIRFFNDRRVKKEILNSPDFKSVLPFLMGVKAGCFNIHKALRDETIYDRKDPNSWDAARVDKVGLQFGQPTSWFKGSLGKQLRKDRSMTRAQKKRWKPKNHASQMRKAEKDYWKTNRKEENLFRKMSKELDSGKTPIMPSGSGLLVCLAGKMNHSKVAQGIASMTSLFRDSSGNHLRKYLVEEETKGRLFNDIAPLQLVNSKVKSSLTKWVFEARNINTSDWSMAVNSEFRPNLEPAFDLADEGLAKHFSKHRFGSKQDFYDVCKKLKKHSLAGGFPDDEPDGKRDVVN